MSTVAQGARPSRPVLDHRALLLAESADLATFLADLPAARWDEPSLCRGWRVRDVVAHMAVGHTMPLAAYGMALARHGFRMDATSFALATQYAERHSPAEILALFRAGTVGPPRAAARMVGVRDLFIDHLVHHQDLRRPLGAPRDIPPERLVAALTGLAAMRTIGCRRRMGGLHLIATDVDFERRRGHLEVVGTAEALLLAVTGRSVAVAELRGAGVETLADRI